MIPWTCPRCTWSRPARFLIDRAEYGSVDLMNRSAASGCARTSALLCSPDMHRRLARRARRSSTPSAPWQPIQTIGTPVAGMPLEPSRPLLAVVVLGQAPLRAHRAPEFRHPAGRPARAERVEGRVSQLSTSSHRAFQVLDVVDAAVARPTLFLSATPSRLVSVTPDFLRVGLLRQDRVAVADEAGSSLSTKMGAS